MLWNDGGQGRNRTADASLFRAGLGDSHLVDYALLSSVRCTGFSAVYWNHNGTKNFGPPKLASTPVHCNLHMGFFSAVDTGAFL